MARGIVRQICIARVKRGPMVSVNAAMAIQGQGLEDDRYYRGIGSYSKSKVGRRQVTLMHEDTFASQEIYLFEHTRRNLLVGGESIELIWLLVKGHDIEAGEALLRPVGYCDPCHVPSKQAGIPKESRALSFRKIFWERGGIICDVIRGGIISVGSPVIAPDKGYGESWDD